MVVVVARVASGSAAAPRRMLSASSVASSVNWSSASWISYRPCGAALGRGDSGADLEDERVGGELGGAVERLRLGGPAGEGDDDRFELVAPVGELVDEGACGRAESLPSQDAGLLEFPQALGQHRRADPWQAALEVSEPFGPEEQLADDQQGPALSEEFGGVGGGAAVAVGPRNGHPATLHLDNQEIYEPHLSLQLP